jgi:hypothetical protein
MTPLMLVMQRGYGNVVRLLLEDENLTLERLLGPCTDDTSRQCLDRKFCP